MNEWSRLPPECLACLTLRGIGPGDRIPKRWRLSVAEWRVEFAGLPRRGQGKLRALRSIADRLGYTVDHLRRVERRLRRSQ